MQGKPPYCKTVSALQTLIRSQAVIDNISYTYTIRACVEHAHIEQPHLEGRQEPQVSSPFRTPTAESLLSWDRRVRPRLV